MTADPMGRLFASLVHNPFLAAALAEQGKVIADACGCGQPVGVCPCGDPRCWHCDPGLGARYTSMVCNSRHAPAQPSGTIQEAPESGLGISGRSDDPQGAEGLSALREELRRTVLARNAANAMRGVHEHRATRLKTELDHAKAALAGDNEAIGLFMLDCTKTAERRREQVDLWQKAAEQAEAKLDRLREPHTRGPRTNTCNDCGQDWPCETIQTIDEETPDA